MVKGAFMLDNTTKFSEQSPPSDTESVHSKDKNPEEKMPEKEGETFSRERELQRARIMDAMEIFAGGVAHDLNNALTGIVSYPEFLLTQLPEDSPFKRPITRIHESGRKAASIVQDLITLTRRGIKNNALPVNINKVVDQFLKGPERENLESTYPSITIMADLDEDLINIEGSPAQIHRALVNLATNAAEAARGNGEIIVSTFNRSIDTPYKGYEEVNAGDYVVLSVSDPGEAVSPEDLERLFEPFYSKKIMGRRATGMGMAVVWAIVKDHGGYIDVRSAPGAGTAIILYFPCKR
jgi:two-component system, cell cycle sensor histidine kinase and response regulator CckA